MLFLQLTHNPELREGYVFEINFVVLLIAGHVNDATKISGEPGFLLRRRIPHTAEENSRIAGQVTMRHRRRYELRDTRYEIRGWGGWFSLSSYGGRQSSVVLRCED